MDKRQGSRQISVDTFDIDASGYMKMSYLSNQLLKCAETHATRHGWGMDELNKNDNTWVLSRVVIEFTDNLPKENEQITIETWVESVMRLFTARNFCFRNSAGAPVGYSRTIWAMINRNNRKPVDLNTICGDDIKEWAAPDIECPITGYTKISVNADEPTDIVKVRYSDIDMNGHMNSCRYIEHVLDLFCEDFHKKHKIKRFEIAYISECVFGDELSLFKEKINDREYTVEICKSENNEVACRSKIIFN